VSQNDLAPSALAWDPDDGVDAWPASVSLAALRPDLRRRRRLVVALAVLGGVVGAVMSVVLGSGSTSSTTLFLARADRDDPMSAMQTDINLLTTHVVAEQVIREQRLDMTPQDFFETVSVTNPSTQLLEVSVSAEDPASSVARAESLAAAYLSFRNDLLTQQAEAANDGRREQASELVGRLEEVTAGIRMLAGSSDTEDQREIDELIGQRGDISGQIARLREDIQAEQVELAAVVSSSRVIDPPRPEPEAGVRFAALSTASGAIGGALLAVGIIVAQAVLSQRPRLRSAIAADLGSPVVVSVPGVRGSRRSARDARAVASARLVEIIAAGSGASDEPLRLALLSAASESDTVTVAAHLAQTLRQRGAPVSVVDLTEAGRLGAILGSEAVAPHRWAAVQRDATGEPVVVRPPHVPTVARRPPVLDGEGERGTDRRSRRVDHGVTIVVAEASPTVGADHVASWADRAIVVVRAGAASHDRLVSTGSVIRSAGLVLVGAVVTGSDRTDDTLGLPPAHADTAAPGLVAGGR
jgi:uncharacterized protein YciW